MENHINHTIDGDVELVEPACTEVAETTDVAGSTKLRDAGFVVTEGLAYAVLFIAVMGAAAAAFSDLGQIVADLVEERLSGGGGGG